MAMNSPNLSPTLAKTQSRWAYNQHNQNEPMVYFSAHDNLDAPFPSSDRRWQKLIEYCREQIILTDAQGKILDMKGTHILGYAHEAYHSMEPWALVHPADRARAQACFHGLLADPGVSCTLELRIRHQAGYYLWLEITATNLLHDPDIGGILSKSIDITAYKQAEEAEREQRKFAEALRDSVAALTGSLDADTVMQQILASATKVVPSEAGRIILFEGNEGRVASLRGFGPEAKAFFNDYRFSIASMALCNVFTTKQPYFVTDTQASSDWLPLPVTAWIRSSIGIPIQIRGEVIGLLVVDSATPHYFQPTDVEKLQAFAGYASLALENAFHVSQLEQRVAAHTTELRAAKDRIEAILNHSLDATLLIHPDLTIAQANIAFTKLFACSGYDCLAQSLLDFIHVEDVARLRATVTMVLQEQSGKLVEVRAWRGERALIEVELSLGLIKGEGLVCTMRDITERKQAAALREQRDFLQLVIDSVPDLILVKDSAGYFQLINERTAQIYGVRPTDMVGKTDADFNVNVAEVAFFHQKDQETLASQQVTFIAEEVVQGRYYQTSKIPLQNVDGQYDHLLVVASDVTERKQAEAALQQALEKEKELGELRSRFVSMASHEFRTPLTSILLLTETLRMYRQKLTDDQITRRLVAICEQVEHLKTIMDDVLQLARIQARRVENNPTWLDLKFFVRTILDEFQDQPDFTHQLRYHCDDALSEVLLDKRLIRQILTNLVSNAIKYSPDGKIIQVRLFSRESALVLQVQDEGIGIPEADLKHLFQPFQRATNVGTVTGTGLGLVITKESVELHGGHIAVESKLDMGTTFTVTIPLPVASVTE